MRSLPAAALGALALLSGARGEAIEITSEEDFEAKVVKSGKFGFVKFLAPWCGHCKTLKPDWDRLGAHFNKDASPARIFDVDCTTDGAKGVCSKYGVEGYPTLKYWGKDTSEMGEKYEDAREFNKLKKFVKDSSKPPCVAATLENCNKKEKAFIEDIKSWDEAKLASENTDISGQIEAAKTLHKEEADLFEKQKEVAMATMKRQEEAKTALEKVSKQHKYKISILEQKSSGSKEEL